jgi:hypothetical protein
MTILSSHLQDRKQASDTEGGPLQGLLEVRECIGLLSQDACEVFSACEPWLRNKLIECPQVLVSPTSQISSPAV